MARKARDTLSEHGATVTLENYAGGHGWRGDVFGAIRQGVNWLGAESDADELPSEADVSDSVRAPSTVE